MHSLIAELQYTRSLLFIWSLTWIKFYSCPFRYINSTGTQILLFPFWRSKGLDITCITHNIRHLNQLGYDEYNNHSYYPNIRCNILSDQTGFMQNHICAKIITIWRVQTPFKILVFQKIDLYILVTTNLLLFFWTACGLSHNILFFISRMITIWGKSWMPDNAGSVFACTWYMLPALFILNWTVVRCLGTPDDFIDVHVQYTGCL